MGFCGRFWLGVMVYSNYVTGGYGVLWFQHPRPISRSSPFLKGVFQPS